MSNSNINLVWFQTTAGHHGKKDLYKHTLNRLKKDVYNLNFFDRRFLSLKVFNNDDYTKILGDFSDFTPFLWHKKDLRINDESPYKDYGYYLLSNYLSDIACCYKEIKKEGNYSKYTYLVEDDSPEILNNNNLQFYIEKAIEKLESNPDIFSVHMRREGRLASDPLYLSEKYEVDGLFIKQDHDYNFQNQVFRTEDMINVSEIIFKNYSELVFIHTERSVRTAIYKYGILENKNFKFISFLPRLVHSVHIGVNDSEEWIASFNL
jgi:hypothetical protein